MKIRSSFVTNSSSSSFVVNTGENTEEVKAKLLKMLDLYNDLMNKDLQFEDVFNEPFVLDVLNDEKYAWKWESNEENLNKVIILSACDNTIPYELFDLIETTFDANREHLG